MDLSARVGVVVFTALLVGSLFVGSAAAQADGGDEIEGVSVVNTAKVELSKGGVWVGRTLGLL